MTELQRFNIIDFLFAFKIILRDEWNFKFDEIGLRREEGFKYLQQLIIEGLLSFDGQEVYTLKWEPSGRV